MAASIAALSAPVAGNYADLAAGLALKAQHGVIVADVTQDGPADKAGLKTQDLLFSTRWTGDGKRAARRNDISTRPVNAW